MPSIFQAAFCITFFAIAMPSFLKSQTAQDSLERRQKMEAETARKKAVFEKFGGRVGSGSGQGSPGKQAQNGLIFPLYEGKIPFSKSAENLEKTEINSDGIEFTTATSEPTLQFFCAKKGAPTVIICPGGGYFGTAGNHEGRAVARRLNQMGINTFVLKYRMPSGRTGERPAFVPFQDAQMALVFARKKAEELQIDPQKIGFLGFSAGGHLAATAAVHFRTKADGTPADSTEMRPAFAALIYPVISFGDEFGHRGSRQNLLGDDATAAEIDFFSLENHVSKEMPPIFIVHAKDDEVVDPRNSTVFHEKCVEKGVYSKLEILAGGGHGFGLEPKGTVMDWPVLFKIWLGDLKL